MTRLMVCLLSALLLGVSSVGLDQANALERQAPVDNLAADNGSDKSISYPANTSHTSATQQVVTGQTSSQSVQTKVLQTKVPQTTTAKPLAGEFTTVSAPDIGTGLLQVTFGLFVVLMIIAGAAWFARRFGHFQATAGGALRIVGGLHLGAKERLVVVQVGEQQLLLGIAPGRISKLHLLEKPLNVTNDVSSKEGMAGGIRQTPGNFREYLSSVLKRDSK